MLKMDWLHKMIEIGPLQPVAAANSPLAMLYGRLLSLPFTVKLGSLGVDKPLLLWINDGLMAVFFLLVALELKREIPQGQFCERAQIALPAMCAAGGMVMPMLIYAALSRGNAEVMAGAAWCCARCCRGARADALPGPRRAGVETYHLRGDGFQRLGVGEERVGSDSAIQIFFGHRGAHAI